MSSAEELDSHRPRGGKSPACRKKRPTRLSAGCLIRVRIGYPIMAFIRLSQSRFPIAQADELAKISRKSLNATTLQAVIGVILKVVVSSVGHLEEVISQMGSCGMTTTAIVLSSPV